MSGFARQGRLMRIRRTSTFRLTAMLGLAFLCAMCALLGLIYLLTERELIGRTDEVLTFEIRALSSVPAARLPQAVRAAIIDNASHLNHFALLDADGHKLVGDFTPPPRLPAGRPIEVAGPGSAPAVRLLAVRISDGGLLVIARDISQIADLRRRMLAILLASGVIASSLLLLAAVALSAAPLRRVRTLTALATRIAAGELTLRMPVSARGDELDVIATTVNAMIEEIARLLGQVKGATDAIAHDLRSPLAHLRGQLERIRSQVICGEDKFVGGGCDATADPQLPALIDTAMADMDTVLARFGALLRIAELEATNRQACFAELDPMVLSSAVCELFEPLAQERDITLVLSGTWGQTIRADEKLLFEAVSNLVENAIKFIAPGGHISIGVTADGETTVLAVRDDGPGIPVEERVSVLRRYYRGSSAQHTAGSGLGLSLVAEIIHLHGYTLELNDVAPGLEVRIICRSIIK
jgi:signal transduction histidine kinase